jgi:tRNA-Thr(GGU) m(6)t(6)A37 methyltransferase TsaA
MSSLVLKVIGTVRSTFREAAGTPIQTALAQGVEGSIEVLPEFAPGLKDLRGFERIWLLYWFDRAASGQLVVKPFLDEHEHGVFATRAPCRPNPIGLSCVRLLGIDGRRLRIGDVDILDGTPLLDIKPYAPALDCFEVSRAGWLQHKAGHGAVADDRFEHKD